MERNTTWAWVIGIIVLLVVIGGLWWWSVAPTQTGAPTGTATTTVATSTATNVAAATVVNKSSQSVASIVAGLTGSSQYAAAWSSTGVGSTVAGKGPYTVFVSTDAGYALLKPGTITNMTSAQKKRMVQYSIVSGKALDINAQDTGSVKTLSGDELNFSVGAPGVVQVNSSYAIAEYKASNGIVYVINQPLIPPTSKNILTP